MCPFGANVVLALVPEKLAQALDRSAAAVRAVISWKTRWFDMIPPERPTIDVVALMNEDCRRPRM
jgi:hypothetical protein